MELANLDLDGTDLDPMDIVCEKVQGHMVVRVAGSLDALEARELLDVPCLEQPTEDVILDLVGVKLLDSAGLGVVTRLMKTFREAGMKLVLSSPNLVVLKTLRLAQMDLFAHLTDSLVGALDILIRQSDTA